MDGPSRRVPCHSTPKRLSPSHRLWVPHHTTTNAKESDQSPWWHVRFDDLADGRLSEGYQVCRQARYCGTMQYVQNSRRRTVGTVRSCLSFPCLTLPCTLPCSIASVYAADTETGKVLGITLLPSQSEIFSPSNPA